MRSKEPLMGDDLVLSILEKELPAFTRRAQKAKDECDARMSVGSDLIALRQEAKQIVQTTLGKYTKENVARLDELVEKEKKLLAIMRKDLSKLMDAQFDAESARDELVQIIARMRFRQGLRKGREA